MSSPWPGTRAGAYAWRLEELGDRARLALMKEDVLEQIVDDYLQMQGYSLAGTSALPLPADGGSGRTAARIVIVVAEQEPDLDVCGRDGLEYVHA